MGAVKTPTRHQTIGNCGKARNCHALRWLVEPLKSGNRQKVHILSFHPRSPGGVASATWRPTVLSRMLSPCFLIGASLQLGRMRMIAPRGFRGWQFWVCLLYFVSLLFVHSNTRYAFHIMSLKELDLYLWLFLCNKL